MKKSDRYRMGALEWLTLVLMLPVAYEWLVMIHDGFFWAAYHLGNHGT